MDNGGEAVIWAKVLVGVFIVIAIAQAVWVYTGHGTGW